MESRINGLSVYTSGSRKNQAIIFVHGFPYNHSMWDAQVEYFSKNYFCVTYDVRGLGASEVGDGQYTMEKYIDDLFLVISELKLNKPILCGLSMGGYISYRAVVRKQSIFKSAIFCDTKAEGDTDKIKLVRANKIKQINEEGLDAFVDEFVPVCFSEKYKTDHSVNFNKVKLLSKTYNPIGVKGALIAMLSRVSSVPFLKQIKIPTLHICGEFDIMTPPNKMEVDSSKIVNSVLKVVPNSGHMSPIENPKFVNTTIENFIL